MGCIINSLVRVLAFLFMPGDLHGLREALEEAQELNLETRSCAEAALKNQTQTVRAPVPPRPVVEGAGLGYGGW